MLAGEAPGERTPGPEATSFFFATPSKSSVPDFSGADEAVDGVLLPPLLPPPFPLLPSPPPPSPPSAVLSTPDLCGGEEDFFDFFLGFLPVSGGDVPGGGEVGWREGCG